MARRRTRVRPERDMLATDTSLEPGVSVNGAPPLIQTGDVDTAQVCGRCHGCGIPVARLHMVERSARGVPAPLVFVEILDGAGRTLRQMFDTGARYRSHCSGCGWSYSTGAEIARNRGRSLRWARR